ncbi:MAG: hypothetical protein H0V55_09250 [Thermoleophilaceae bacterium]|jgi:hypothetical protein|nr:hypothetical protein [Thermoleophilaceae bacterium]
MPTTRPRHTITEVGDVADALAKVRSVAGEADIRRLIVLGADTFLREADDRARAEARRAALKERLLARIAASAPVDPDAAREVRERGWARDLDT